MHRLAAVLKAQTRSADGGVGPKRNDNWAESGESNLAWEKEPVALRAYR